MRQESNVDMLKQYVTTINERFLRPEKHYDPDTKTFNVGSFYLFQGYGKRGVDYEVREVENEQGQYIVLGNQGCSSEQLLFWLDGFVQSHYATCAMLGYSLEENVNNVSENTTDEYEVAKSIDEGKDEVIFIDENGEPLDDEELFGPQEGGTESEDDATEETEQTEEEKEKEA